MTITIKEEKSKKRKEECKKGGKWEECEECGGTITKEGGFYICRKCGLIKEQELMPKYTIGENIGEKEERKRKGTQYVEIERTLKSTNKLGTEIGRIERREEWYDSRKKPLSATKREKYRKLKNLNIWIRNKEKWNTPRITKIIQRVGEILEIKEQVIERAICLYKRYEEEYKEKINNHVVLGATAMFIAVREKPFKCPVTLKEIEEAYKKLGHRVKGRSIIVLAQHIGRKVRKRKSEEYIARACNELCKNQQIKKRIKQRYKEKPEEYEQKLLYCSRKLLESIPTIRRGGRQPYQFAVATAYIVDKYIAKEVLAKGSAITQKLAAKATGAAEFTIREHSSFIKTHYKEKIIEAIKKWEEKEKN